MRPVLTPAESAGLDRDSAARGVEVAFLMENAGRAVARAAVELTGGAYGRRAVAVCGRGNNGGDGLVAARHLARWGMRVSAALVDGAGGLRGVVAENLGRARRGGVSIVEGPEGLTRDVSRADVVIDAIFGTGFHGQAEGAAAEMIRTVNAGAAPVVAVDVPSGVDGGTGAVEGAAIEADRTVALGALKPGLLLYPGAALAGVVDVADIGFPDGLIRSDLALVESADVAGWLPHRVPDTNKRATGTVLVVGGSRGMTGAVRLMAGAAYRAGAGLVTVAVPERILPVVQASLVEATFAPLPETHDGTVARRAVDVLKDRMEDVDAVAIGPGLTRQAETAEAVRALVAMCPVPVVVDADGLNAFEGRTGDMAENRTADTVLTPHAGEFARLTGRSVQAILGDRIESARRAAAETRATILLKGNPTVVARPDGIARLVTTGGPALATGGTGDVLTGVVAGLLARGMPAGRAAAAGAFAHGLAGTMAGLELGDGTTAGEVLARVARAFRAIREAA